ncbi:MAG: hypothetical protein NUV67_03615, partial [archaeon]|nr:hypothetical protein [archaeon]
DTTDVSEFLKVLKKKHLIDDVVVASMNGSSIISSNGHAVSTAVSGAALYSYVQSEHPKSETILIKSNGHWNMIFPMNKKLYLVKASSDVSVVELKALATEIDSFLAQNAVN